ncbi:MAG TPA: GNAT family N-acetyltransferase [Archangium sp.]|jgi:GNAT superfamily N-acetyltransferase|uniref:GNAT family N-acetyltransferase n=1 Tax=Archangium sp. TaxID=1872627 RepID=UPI002EDA5116
MYDIRQIELSEPSLQSYHRLLTEVFPTAAAQFTPAYLTWQYVRNPAGPAVGFNAFAGETLAAHYVTLPIRVQLEGRACKGLLSLNTATHPQHQGKGLFTRLADATYQYAASQGYELVVGVANANSTPGFTRKLGFQLVAPLEARMGVGPLPAQDPRFTSEFEVLWDHELLGWRLANPSRTYRLRPRGESMRIEAPTGKAGIQAILGDFPRALCPTALERTAPASPNPVRLWLGIDPSRRFQRSLYTSIPKRLRPSPLNLIYRDLTGKRASLDMSRLRFRALDFDAY